MCESTIWVLMILTFNFHVFDCTQSDCILILSLKRNLLTHDESYLIRIVLLDLGRSRCGKVYRLKFTPDMDNFSRWYELRCYLCYFCFTLFTFVIFFWLLHCFAHLFYGPFSSSFIFYRILRACVVQNFLSYFAIE